MRADHRSDKNADQLDADQPPGDDDTLADHVRKDRYDHANQHAKGRSAGHQKHWQPGHRCEKRHVEKAAANTEKGGDGRDEDAAHHRNPRLELELLAIEGKPDLADHKGESPGDENQNIGHPTGHIEQVDPKGRNDHQHDGDPHVGV